MIRKLLEIIKNYDIIMEIVKEHKKSEVKFTKVEPKKDNEKSYSMFNVPREQQDYILKKKKGEL